MIRNQKILVAILNWGLGHATRTIPIIEELLSFGNEIHLASDGHAADVLRETFPKLPLLQLPSYDPKYPSDNMIWNMATQLPKFWRTKCNEHKSIIAYGDAHKIDVVISDNRYGCFLPGAKNIFISHQLNLQVPIASALANHWHARFLNAFEEVWIPDDPNKTLSGKLSDTTYLNPKISVKYVGIQSRLKRGTRQNIFDIAVVLSGPEPQRSILEKLVTYQLKSSGLKVILVRGTINSKQIEDDVYAEVLDYAGCKKMSKIIAQSSFIVCRSGYSTLMDLKKLGGKALLIPTPGQTEQIYLANRMQTLKKAAFQHQNE
ncbi:MAG: glycosyltransferase, partial [Croceitalea sp.]|nr:glycosyltransferase [Croceitalea sp.]